MAVIFNFQDGSFKAGDMAFYEVHSLNKGTNIRLAVKKAGTDSFGQTWTASQVGLIAFSGTTTEVEGDASRGAVLYMDKWDANASMPKFRKAAEMFVDAATLKSIDGSSQVKLEITGIDVNGEADKALGAYGSGGDIGNNVIAPNPSTPAAPTESEIIKNYVNQQGWAAYYFKSQDQPVHFPSPSDLKWVYEASSQSFYATFNSTMGNYKGAIFLIKDTTEFVELENAFVGSSLPQLVYLKLNSTWWASLQAYMQEIERQAEAQNLPPPQKNESTVDVDLMDKALDKGGVSPAVVIGIVAALGVAGFCAYKMNKKKG